MADVVSFSPSKGPAFGGSPSARDWTNQELSDFFRAVAMLNQAGISVFTERGITDEGDPWVAFCRADGEVFIHFCRLDGQYLLDSPALAAPLRGTSFSGLIDRFIERAAVASAPNVVAFRASKVLLHPAALLTILVWTLYVNSSGTGTPLQAGEVSPDSVLAALHQDDDLDASSTIGTDAATKDDAGKAVDTKLAADAIPGEKSLARLFAQLEAQISGHASNVAAVQLMAAITILSISPPSADLPEKAVGIVLNEGIRLEPVRLFSEQHVEQSAEMAPVQFVPAEKELVQATKVQGPEPITITAVVNTVHVDVPKLVAAQHVAVVDAQPTGNVVTEAAILAPVVLALPYEAAAPASKAPVFQLSQVTDKIDAGSLLRFTLDGVDVLSTMDANTTNTIVLAVSGVTDKTDAPTPMSEPTAVDEPKPSVIQTSMMKYDDAARSFVEHFITHGGAVEMVASPNEIMLIDVTAFDEVTDHAYARSWVLADGGIVSTVGHYDMFADFALVWA